MKGNGSKRYASGCSYNFFSYSFLLVLLMLPAWTGAQIFGGNPSSIKWQQIDTDTARIIFPEGLQDAANRVADVMHYMQRHHGTGLGNRLRKIDVVLQNQTTQSNAYVGLGPYRSEFYLMPPQNSFELGGMNWLDNLSLHEYRHVQQFTNFNVGLARVFGFIFGQQGQAVANSLAVPDYYYEGDAVYYETALSRQGRGRLPYFFKGYQSLFFDKKDFSFMKLRNGSMRDFVPDHYALGYLLTAYGREKYGPGFWDKVTHDAVRFKPVIYNWQNAIKTHAGISYKEFVQNAFDHYQDQWQQQAPAQDYTTIAASPRVRTDYKYPYVAEGGNIIALKRGYRDIPTFVVIDENNNERKLAVRDIAHDDYYAYRNGRIVYSTYNPDSRWGYREYSNIVMMDVASKQQSTITKQGRFFSPDISADGQRIVAVDMQPDQSSAIVIMDLDGKPLHRYQAEKGTVFTYPKFSKDGTSIFTFSRNEAGKMALVEIEHAGDRQTIHLPYRVATYAFPVVQNDSIFFSATNQQRDEIWMYDIKNKQVKRVATHATGLYHAVYDPHNNRLITANFSSTGFSLVGIANNKLLWETLDTKLRLTDLYVPNALQQEDTAMLAQASAREYPAQQYKKTIGFFNFHSWRPLYDLQEFSFTLYGQNVLNTFQSELSYTFNRNETSHRAGFAGIYGGWYLQPTAGINHTWNRTVRYNADTIFNYNELNLNAGLRLPLNLSGGKQYRFLTLLFTFNKQQVQWTGLGKSLLRSLDFNYLEGRLLYSGQIQQAVQHIYPRWAQSILVNYRHTISGVSANQLLLNGNIYLPGLHRNHSLVISAAYQQRDTLGQYLFSNSFPFSRGYNAIDFPRMWRFGFNYHFPLFYPDFGFGQLVYFQRIRANTFYDMTTGKSLRTRIKYPFDAVGGEIYFDTKWFNQQPVTIGLRYTRLLHDQLTAIRSKNQWEIILPVSLFD